MGYRIRSHSDQLFLLFAEVVWPTDAEDGFILHKFPDDFVDEGVLRSVPLFCFPTGPSISGPVQQFSFVLTNGEGNFTFGFCRSNTEGNICLCILSHLPWHDLFYKLLNYIGDLQKKNPGDDSLGFLRAAYRSEVPQGGDILHVIYKIQKVEFQCSTPDLKKLPTIPENRSVTEYFNALDLTNMIVIFASLLNERRIIVTSKKLGRLSACVMACEILLFPLHCAPMPYIIGVPGDLMPMVLKMDLGEVVIVDADNNKVSTPFDDIRDIPSSVISIIRAADGKMFGDGVARAFMRALVMLIGGYRFGLRMPPGEKISFDVEKFIRSRSASLQVFLSKMSELQVFRQFIEERLNILNTGIGFSDEFEAEVSLLIDHESDANRDVSIADQYRRWTSKGGSLFRSVTNKMKDRSKDAVKGIRDKINDLNIKEPTDSEWSYNDQPQAAFRPPAAIVPSTTPTDGRSLSRSSRNERNMVALSTSTNTSSGSSAANDRDTDDDRLFGSDFNSLTDKPGTSLVDGEEPLLINLNTDLTSSSSDFFDLLTSPYDSTLAAPPLPPSAAHPPLVAASSFRYPTSQNYPVPGFRSGTTLPPNWNYQTQPRLPFNGLGNQIPFRLSGSYPVTSQPGSTQWYTNSPMATAPRPSYPSGGQIVPRNQQNVAKKTGEWENFE